MAYKKTLIKKKTTQSKSWYKKKYSVEDLAIKALQGVKELKGLVNSERMVLDSSFATTLNTSGTVTHLTDISQGDSSSTRTGNSLLLKTVYVKNRVIWNSLDVLELGSIRYWIVMDTQQAADTSPTLTDIFNNLNGTQSMTNVTTQGRFKILKSGTIKQNRNLAFNDVNDFYTCPSFGTHIKYNGTAGSDIQKNGIYLVQYQSDATTPPSTYTVTRVTWHDN